jgi:hypothetical protein
MADGDFTGTCPRPEGYISTAPIATLALCGIVHSMSHDEGREWAYVALNIALAHKGMKFWEPGRHFNPSPMHWANQPFWAGT